MGGVLSGAQLLLVGLLVVVTVSGQWSRTGSLLQHARYLRMYFNLNLLGMDNQGLYEDSDNIDESYN